MGIFSSIKNAIFGKDEDETSQTGLVDLMARSLDVMQSQISRMQLALDPPPARLQEARCEDPESLAQCTAATVLPAGRQVPSGPVSDTRRR